MLSALRSKDPNTKVGACIVTPSLRIVGVGYNGLPRGCNDGEFPWERQGEFLETKYPFVVHAELNAILNSTRSLEGCTIYVSLFLVMNVLKLLFKVELKKLSIVKINTKVNHLM